jgi:lysophospholipase L1-like esterase
MTRFQRAAVAVCTFVFVVGFTPSARAQTPRTVRLLESGSEPVRVVAFGDSITGTYYHTGARRAWIDMLGIALERLYPKARVEAINAGVSGNSTVQGLNRIRADVLDRKPHLVAVMFGMNDLVRNSPKTFRDNLTNIVGQCRGVGAEVVLMTPNAILPEDGRRPEGRVEEFAQITRDVGRELGVPVADCYRAYAEVRRVSRRAFMEVMSDTIHPNMRGHKIFAEEVAHAVSGRRVSLDDVAPLSPAIPRTLELLERGAPVRVIAMKPYDALIGPALVRLSPGARVEITPWDVALKGVAEIEGAARERGWFRFHGKQAKGGEKPDLVIVAIPATALAPGDEQFYRSYTWALNYAISFGPAEWDVFAVLPSVADPDLDAAGRTAERLALDVIEGQDVGWLARRPNDRTPAADVLAEWLQAQARGAGK